MPVPEWWVRLNTAARCEHCGNWYKSFNSLDQHLKFKRCKAMRGKSAVDVDVNDQENETENAAKAQSKKRQRVSTKRLKPSTTPSHTLTKSVQPSARAARRGVTEFSQLMF